MMMLLKNGSTAEGSRANRGSDRLIPTKKASVNDYRCIADSAPIDLKYEVTCQDGVTEIDERSRTIIQF